MRWRVAAPAALALLMLGGCAGKPMQLGAFARKLAAEEALLLPPPGGPAVLSVIERRYDNALEQRIYLQNATRVAGENLFTIRLFGTSNPFIGGDNRLSQKPVTEAGIAAEMRQALPGQRMLRSRFFVQNGYGPFGYAFGRSGSDLCLYAWQQIRSPDGVISPLANHGSIQIRLRYCEADSTEERLLAIMYHFTITAAVDSASWNPYGPTGPARRDIGATGSPIYPRAGEAQAIVPALPAAEPARPQGPRISTAFAPRATPAPALPRRAAGMPAADRQVSGPTVPSPLAAGALPAAAGGAVTQALPAVNAPRVPSPFAATNQAAIAAEQRR